MKYQSTSIASTHGFSLIEFMVAMVLGIILIGGAISVYLASKRSYTEVEQVAELSENGRFAMQLLNESLRHSGFFGATNFRDIELDGSLGAVAGDCTGEAQAYRTTGVGLDARLTDVLFAVVANASGQAFGCITDARPGTDVLVVKALLPEPLYDADPQDPNAPLDGVVSFPNGLVAEEVYVIANREGGVLLDGADTPPPVDDQAGGIFNGVAWPYRVQIYYVRDLSVPTFSRRMLSWNGAGMAMNGAPEDLVPGVEDFRVRFGFFNSAGTAYSYAEAAELGATEWERVELMEVFMLLRSRTEDPQYEETKSYRLADQVISPDDNLRRHLIHSTISLRNPKLIIRAGG